MKLFILNFVCVLIGMAGGATFAFLNDTPPVKDKGYEVVHCNVIT